MGEAAKPEIIPTGSKVLFVFPFSTLTIDVEGEMSFKALDYTLRNELLYNVEYKGKEEKDGVLTFIFENKRFLGGTP